MVADQELAFGKADADGIARVIRFANRVPLQYQLSACSSTKAVMDVAWKSYGLQQSKGALPVGPLVIMVHGFPESWYSWRHQIGPVADAGYQVVALDVRGYGGSDKPDPIEA